ncbi:MAG: hypothetical protein IT361_02555 [Gemmatimonadaceae bacterium]|nr:hypothetical protein [Gemmatimonadaceae bacterium]
MAFELQSQAWPERRAILLIHGIGNATRGDYVELLAEIRTMLGAAADTTAIYQLWYDQVNDWFQGKTQLGDLLSRAMGAISERLADPQLGPAVSESIGDILWPVLVADARTAAREACIAQLKQIVQDGVASGVPARRQHLTIICHSLGCFHTYEVLHHIAKFPSHGLQPGRHEVQFANVVFMASPVQMIRTVADAMGSLVPNKRWLYCVQGDSLTIPSETTVSGMVVPSVKRWVSITGNLDPVGGFFFRNRAPWAYMDVAGQVSRIDDQQALNIGSKAELSQRLMASLRERERPQIGPSNPHSWEQYVIRNAPELRDWCTT